MNLRYLRTLLLAAAILPLVAGVARSESTKRVLFFTKSSGYEHQVIKHVDGGPSYAEKVLQKLGPKHGFAFTFSKDGSKFGADYLKQFDAVLFYTSGDLMSVGKDGSPAMSAEGKQALLDAIARGELGYVGLHSASDSFHTGESGSGNPPQEKRLGRYRNNGDKSDPYILCLGGEFINHGPQQVATARVADPHFPGYGELGDALTVMEEWYSLKDFAPNLRVQLVMETEGMEGSDYQRPPYPIAWARMHGKGRVAFNAMGHREDVWDSEAFESMLVGMLSWATGRVDADVTPNLQAAAPQHATIQPPRK